jgi:hypothetical protein
MSEKLPKSPLSNGPVNPRHMKDADSELSSDNDSRPPPAKNSYSKRPARKKPIELT